MTYQGQHGGLLDLVLRALAQVRHQRGVVARVGQLLSRMQRCQRPLQLRCEVLVPPLPGQIAELAFRAEPREEGLRGPRRRLCSGLPAHRAEHHAQVARRLGLQLRPLVRLRPLDHPAQRPLRRRPPAFGRQQRRDDARILGLVGWMRQLTPALPDPLQLAARRLQLAADDVNLRPPSQDQCPQRGIPGGFSLRHGAIGLREGAIERSLFAVRDPQVVTALGDPLSPAAPIEGRTGDFPGPDRLGVASPQVTDDAEVVGAAADRCQIGVEAGEHEGPRAVVRGLVETPADQRHGTARVQRTTLDSPLATLAGLVERRVEPLKSFLRAPELRLRGPVQQCEARRLHELAAFAGGEIFDDLGVLSRRGELPGLIDYDG